MYLPTPSRSRFIIILAVSLSALSVIGVHAADGTVPPHTIASVHFPTDSVLGVEEPGQPATELSSIADGTVEGHPVILKAGLWPLSPLWLNTHHMPEAYPAGAGRGSLTR